MRIRTHTNPLCYTQRFDKLDPYKILPNFNGQIDFEIGFGQSEFLIKHAQKHPNKLTVGSEIRKMAVDLMHAKINSQETAINNIHLIHGNGNSCIEDLFEDKSIDNIFIFHPDPWIKRKHLKRRVITEQFLSLARKKLKSNGKIYISTDSEFLWADICKTFEKNKFFTIYDDTEFWDNAYSTHWSDMSKKKNKKINFATYQLS